jgi:hypothetical protein
MRLFIGANIATVAKLGFVANDSSALSSANGVFTQENDGTERPLLLPFARSQIFPKNIHRDNAAMIGRLNLSRGLQINSLEIDATATGCDVTGLKAALGLPASVGCFCRICRSSDL